MTRGGDGAAHFALSRTGTLLYGTGVGSISDELVWVDRQGRTQLIDSTLSGPFGDLALSPDGRRLAFTQRDGNIPNIWTKELDDGPVGKLTLEGQNNGPAWSVDGREVTFVHSTQSGQQDLYSRRADGSGNPTMLLHADRPIDYGFVSRDGQWVLYQTDPDGASTGRDLFARGIGSDTATIALAASEANEWAPRLSPDGRWLAYVTFESGRTQVSVSGGLDPLWARDGSELFYEDLAGTFFVAGVETSPTFRVVERTPLFDRSAYSSNISMGLMYDVAPDAQRFVMTRRRGAASEQLVLVQNWFAELLDRGGR